MEKNPLGTNIVTQVGILVHDIEKSIKEFAAILGMEEPGCITTGPIEETQGEYRGQPCDARAKLAFFNVGGNLTLELIEPDEKPSTWREDLDKYGEGVHHLAFVVNGMKQVISRLEANGIPLIQKGEYQGGRYAYMDSRKTMKTLIELLEND
ncbi:MAG: VOC family protein [Firmicutes bacterium]|nr:VOC family protein [Bacillota bacterium]